MPWTALAPTRSSCCGRGSPLRFHPESSAGAWSHVRRGPLCRLRSLSCSPSTRYCLLNLRARLASGRRTQRQVGHASAHGPSLPHSGPSTLPSDPRGRKRGPAAESPRAPTLARPLHSAVRECPWEDRPSGGSRGCGLSSHTSVSDAGTPRVKPNARGPCHWDPRGARLRIIT